MPVSSTNQARLAAARAGVSRGGKIAYDALDFGVAAKNVYGSGSRLEGINNGSVAVTKYKQLKSDIGLRNGTWEEDAFARAGDVANVSGMVISAIALPKLAQQTVTSFKELSTVIHDPNATTDQRLDKLEATTRAGAGTIFSAQGVVLGAKATSDILARHRGMATVLSKVSEGKITRMFTSPVGKVFNALLPVADGAVFVGELIATRRVFKDPTATSGTKAREVLNLGLASMKVAFWMLPGVAWLREAYAFANFIQLGLSLYDFQKTMAPHFKTAFQDTVWGIQHPAQALAAVTQAAGRGLAAVGHAVTATLGWLGSKLSNPAQTLQNAKTETSTWYNGLLGKGRQIVSTYWPGQNASQAPTQVAYAPQASTMSVPPAFTGTVPAVPSAAPALPSALPPAPVPPAIPAPVPAPILATPAPAPVLASLPQTTQAGGVPAPQAFQQAMSQLDQMRRS